MLAHVRPVNLCHELQSHALQGSYPEGFDTISCEIQTPHSLELELCRLDEVVPDTLKHLQARRLEWIIFLLSTHVNTQTGHPQHSLSVFPAHFAHA